MIGSELSSEEVIDTTAVDALVEIELDVANEEVVADTELVQVMSSELEVLVDDMAALDAATGSKMP
jgi:hypothetical protein